MCFYSFFTLLSFCTIMLTKLFTILYIYLRNAFDVKEKRRGKKYKKGLFMIK